MEKIFNKIESFIIYSLLFIFPFFFLNITQEYFITNKFYLLGFGVLLLIFLSTVKILILKKISWKNHGFDGLVVLFLTAIAISTLLSSPNKVQALLNPSFGLLFMIILAILYFYLSRQRSISINFNKLLSISSVLLSTITIFFFFQPIKTINSSFTTIGSQLDLVIFLGFGLIFGLTQISFKKISTDKQSIVNYSLLILNLIAISLTIYSLFKGLILPPFRLSWYAAVEILKNPQATLIGIGVDNFSAIFTRVKDFTYNQSPLWQINSFNVSRSAVLQIFTETGILGLLAFGLLIFNVVKQLISENFNKSHFISFGYLLICLFVFPTSLPLWFLFFVLLGLINQTPVAEHEPVDLSHMLPIYIGIVVISFVLIGTSGYFLGRSFASEIYFKKSLNGVINNSAKQVYDNQRQAIILNPYIEKYRSNFAQTNLLIANNIAQKKPQDITEQDRQTITQAIQASISEGKAVVSLNPQKADGWQALASIYLNIINAAKGADVWTVSAYQRAILADPQNPSYRVGLGGVYYFLKRYDDAIKFFEQAISLKPDWPNANYNYAWANFQAENYPQAVNAMQNTLTLINPKLNKADYEKVQKELEEFKKKLPNPEETVTIEEKTKPGSLNLPTPPTTQISPKIELPKESSPETK